MRPQNKETLSSCVFPDCTMRHFDSKPSALYSTITSKAQVHVGHECCNVLGKNSGKLVIIIYVFLSPISSAYPVISLSRSEGRYDSQR